MNNNDNKWLTVLIEKWPIMMINSRPGSLKKQITSYLQPCHQEAFQRQITSYVYQLDLSWVAGRNECYNPQTGSIPKVTWWLPAWLLYDPYSIEYLTLTYKLKGRMPCYMGQGLFKNKILLTKKTNKKHVTMLSSKSLYLRDSNFSTSYLKWTACILS